MCIDGYHLSLPIKTKGRISSSVEATLRLHYSSPLPLSRSHLIEHINHDLFYKFFLASLYKSIQWVILVAHKMDYKNHPHFTIIHRLVEENELPKVGQNDDQIEIVGETADRPQQITQQQWQLREH